MAKYDAAGDKIKKNKVKVFIVLIVFGIVLMVLGYILCKNTDMSKYYNYVDIEKNYSGDKISQVNIDHFSGNINIERSTDNNIYVKCKNIPEDVKIGVDEQKGEFYFKESDILSNFIYFGWMDDEKKEVSIYLPDKEYNEIVIELGAGKSKVMDIEAKNIIIDHGAGNVELENIKYKNLDIDSGAGKINAKNLQGTGGGETSLDIGAGDVKIESSKTADLEVDSGAGSLSFQGDVEGNIEIDSGAGSVKFELAKSEDMYEFTGDLKGKYGSKDGKYEVNAQSGAGKITFEFGK